jgi:FkbM family methyltransferase
MSAPSSMPSDSLSFPMRAAVVLNRILPRGKGAVPRWIGARIRKDPRNTVVTRHGARLSVEPSSLDVYAHILNAGRTWNWNVLAATAAMLRPGGTLYDIGANIGFVSLEIATIFRTPDPSRQVSIVSFEPLPALAAAIRESAVLNGLANVTVLSDVVSDREGETELFLGSHSIHASTRARESRSRVLRCPVVRIDSLVAAGAIPPPTAIKIDVEGGELAAFRGAAETIRSHRPEILFESDENSTRFGYERRDILSLLSSLGPYRFLRVTADGDALEPLAEGESAATAPADILATTRSDQETKVLSEWLRTWAAARRITVAGTI